MENWRNHPEFDDQTVQALKSAVGDDAFDAMKIQFREDLEKLRLSYAEACGKADAEAARETAHALKGAASNIGLMRLGALAAKLERGAKEDVGELDATFVSAIECLMGEA